MYITGLLHADQYKKRSHIFNILKESFSIQKATEKDCFRDVIIKDTSNKRIHHIYSIEEAKFSQNCFIYIPNRPVEDATKAFILTENDKKYVICLLSDSFLRLILHSYI